MGTFRRGWNIFGLINRYIYARAIQGTLFKPKDSFTDAFVLQVPIDEGFQGVADCDVMIDEKNKILTVIAKNALPQEPTAQIGV